MLIGGASKVGLRYDGCDHAGLIHVVVEVFITCNADADELFGGRVGDFILVGVECSDEEIPFAN